MVQVLRRSIATPGPTIRGALIITESGLPFLSTPDSLKPAADIANALLSQIEIPRLRQLRLAQVMNDDVLDTANLDPNAAQSNTIDLTRQSKCLDKLSPSQDLAFWFTDSSFEGQPLLLLARNKEKLKALAIPAKGKGKNSQWTIGYRQQRSADLSGS